MSFNHVERSYLDPFASDVLDFSIDPHCHIIPNVDDGSPDMETSIAMAERAVKSGIRIIAATPHGNHPIFETNYSPDFLRKEVNELNKVFTENNISVRIVPGTEVYLTDKVPELFESGKLITWADENRFILTELGFRKYSPALFDVIDYFLGKNITPIIAHPERYLWLPGEPEVFHKLNERGCRFQFNVMGINGLFGAPIQQLAFELIRQADFWTIGTDSHTDAVRYWELDSVRKNLTENIPHIRKSR